MITVGERDHVAPTWQCDRVPKRLAPVIRSDPVVSAAQDPDRTAGNCEVALDAVPAGCIHHAEHVLQADPAVLPDKARHLPRRLMPGGGDPWSRPDGCEGARSRRAAPRGSAGPPALSSARTHLLACLPSRGTGGSPADPSENKRWRVCAKS